MYLHKKYRFKGTWDGEGKVTKSTLKRAEERNIRTYDSISAFLNAVNLLGFEHRQIRQELDFPCTVNRRKFYFVTSSENIWVEATERGINEKDMIWVDRNDPNFVIDATKRIEGTMKYYQFRGMDKAVRRMVRVREKRREGNNDVVRMATKEVECYPVYTSRIPCGCDLCLVGDFMNCVYLETRGGLSVEPHWMQKK